ncbi:uncharacterized protein LOC108737852 [Agrilus planipennis]|uniref:Uncharacterized protein LOC108737852 n=1 Tax=Agrilus planipennis TaxID=224129 RepID=A0A1W4WRE6_AGRPL|nr:uncharacterized protein LOC108737852 [Agrilus planipennis]
MSRLRPAKYKKSLIRNTEQPLPKTTVTFEHEEKQISQKEKSESEINHYNFPSERNSRQLISQSVSKTPSKIINLVHPTSRTTTMELEKKSQSTLNEKTLKYLNFPTDKKIFKDLIPLSVEETEQKAKQIPSRAPYPQKDKEPQLADFVKTRPHHEFIYQVPMHKQEKSVNQNYDGHRVYKIMLNWKQ